MSPATSFKNKKVLITLGPTREYLDSVRFLSNGSSGKMGLALAQEFLRAGARVTLIAGPGVEGTALRAKRIPVVSALQMFAAVQKEFKACDYFISAAAVSDFRAEKISAEKIKRKTAMQLRLIPNPDILAEVAQHKKNQICVGFALEDAKNSKEKNIRTALEKLRKKNCDWIILNSTTSMESEKIDAVLISSDGSIKNLGRIRKAECAKKICQAIQPKNF